MQEIEIIEDLEIKEPVDQEKKPKLNCGKYIMKKIGT
jgi:hypothetical protein